MSGSDFQDGVARRPRYDLSRADYLDGIVPVRRRVSVKIDPEGCRITLSGDDVEEAWAFHDLRLIPSESRAGHLTLTLGDNGAPRLVLTEAHIIRKLLEVHPDLGATAPARGQVHKAIVFGAGALAALAAIVFVLMPMLAQRLAPMISPEAEVAFATTVRNQTVDRMFPTCGDAETDAAWDSMVAALTADVDLPYDLDVSIVRSPDINAFAMPGGQVVFFSGLIDAAESPDEVAAVLAHEIAHVVYRDVTVGLLRRTGTYGLLGLMAGDVTGAASVPALADSLINAAHSQTAESRADAFAAARMEAAGQSPEALARMFRRMRARYGEGEASVYDYFRSHPALQGRIEASEAAGAVEASAPIVTDAQWQALRTACDQATWVEVPPLLDLDEVFGLDLPGPDADAQTPQARRTGPAQMTQVPPPAPSVTPELQPQSGPAPEPQAPPRPEVNRLPQVTGGGGTRPTTIRVEPARP